MYFGTFLGREDAWNALEIGHHLYVLPLGDSRLRLINDRAADLHYQPASWLQYPVSLRDQAANYFKTGLPRENRHSRLKFANLQLDLIFLHRAHVRRIGDYEIESVVFHAGEQIGFMRSEERRVGKECRSRWS